MQLTTARKLAPELATNYPFLPLIGLAVLLDFVQNACSRSRKVQIYFLHGGSQRLLKDEFATTRLET